jgi:DNA primase
MGENGQDILGNGKARRKLHFVQRPRHAHLAGKLAAIEIHMPLSKTDSREKPDFVFFDIDPEPPVSFEEATTVALLLKEKLDKIGLKSYIKTSGKKGLRHGTYKKSF